MLLSWRLASSLVSLASTVLQNCRIVNLVSKLQFSYQTAASAATPLPLFRTSWTIFANEVHCLAALLDVSAPYVQLLVCVQFGSQIFFNLLFSASQYSSAPLVPVSLVPPLPSLSLLSFLSRSPLRARGLVRFLVPRRIVRLEHLESADCETADLLPSCVCFFSFLLPASSTL